MSAADQPIGDAAIRRGASWLDGAGPESDVVISSRARLARNLAGFPFAAKCSAEQRQQIASLCREGLRCCGLAEPPLGLVWADVDRLAPLDRSLLVERHIISKEHAKGPVAPTAGPAGAAGTAGATASFAPRGVAFTEPDEALSIMVNEEDHLRIQVMRSGLRVADAFAQADAVDNKIETRFDYAFTPRFGYLTACPTNVGCGLRMSAMLHLPALKLSGEIEKVRKAARDMQLAVRGFYGEGSDAAGDLFQISNQTTLGKTEGGILRALSEEILPEIVNYERLARRLLLERRRRLLEDQVFRALGTLRSARLLAPDEALGLLSQVRLGILCGLITELDLDIVTQLFLLTQPAHLQRAVGRELDQQGRREARADLVRQAVGGR